MPRTLLDLSSSALRTAKAIPEAELRGLNKAALHTTKLIRAEIRSVTGDMRLSGVGARGAKVGARYDVLPAWHMARISANGPLHLIERDTAPHDIQPRGYRVSKKSRPGKVRYLGKGKALKFGGGFYRRASMAGGSRGKHPFERGVKKAAPDTARIFQAEVRRVIQREWS